MLKFKWLAQEKYVLREAYARGFSLKIMALSLGRTETAVSKQLQRSGLRPKKDVCGPSKGMQKHSLKEAKDANTMMGIVHHAFKETGLSELNLRKEALLHAQRKKNVPFYFTQLQALLGENQTFSTENRRVITHRRPSQDDKHTFKSLIYVESWARHQGFEFKRLNQSTGLPLYIIQGRPQSHAQFCMRVNDRRLQRKLPVFVVTDWQKER